MAEADPLHMVNTAWQEGFAHALKDRLSFDEMADDAYVFYESPNVDRIWERIGIDPADMTFHVNYSKAAVFVALYRGQLFFRNPVRHVVGRYQASHDTTGLWADPQGMPVQTPRNSNDELVAGLVGKVLNWTPRELKLKKQSHAGIDQALLTGRGCLWTEFDGRTGMIGSFHGDVRDLFIDPNCSTIENAFWIARRRRAPAWWLQRQWGLAPGELRPGASIIGASDKKGAYGGVNKHRENASGNMVTYYEVFSRAGLGARIGGIDQGSQTTLTALENQMAARGVGDYVFLVLAPDHCSRPLNINPQWDMETQLQAMTWPIPFWRDGAWPVSVLDFMPLTGTPWPMSPLQPARGALIYLNWLYSHLANKVRVTMRDFLLFTRTLTEEQRYSLEHGSDLFTMDMSDEQIADPSKVFQFAQHPELNKDPFLIAQMIESQIDDWLGLTELMTGRMSKQMRTQAEATARTEFTRIRPDTMSDAVEEWQSEAARKEAIASRVLLNPMDGAGQLTTLGRVLGGPMEAQLWNQFVKTDWDTAVQEMEYTVEAGSIRKPSKDREVDNAHLFGQMLLPTATNLLAGGDPKLFNNIVRMLARAMDLGDVQDLLIGPTEMNIAQQAMAGATGPSAPGMAPVGSQMQGPGGSGPTPGARQPGQQHRGMPNINGRVA